MLRQIIKIDEDLCDGCGVCIPACKEGALQVIDGKCRLVGDLFCDGLGACIGECPQGAITIEEREAEPYDEVKVIQSLISQPRNVMKAHLEHLWEHNAKEFFNQAIDYLNANNIDIPFNPMEKEIKKASSGCSCPGSAMMDLRHDTKSTDNDSIELKSELTQWPVQLHLVNPAAPYFVDRELILMSTCGPLVNANVHQNYIKDRSVVVACPKLDITDPYVSKLAHILEVSNTPKLIIVRIEVPCCGGLTQIAHNAAIESGRSGLTIEEHVLRIDGSLKANNIIFKN